MVSIELNKCILWIQDYHMNSLEASPFALHVPGEYLSLPALLGFAFDVWHTAPSFDRPIPNSTDQD